MRDSPVHLLQSPPPPIRRQQRSCLPACLLTCVRLGTGRARVTRTQHALAVFDPLRCLRRRRDTRRRLPARCSRLSSDCRSRRPDLAMRGRSVSFVRACLLRSPRAHSLVTDTHSRPRVRRPEGALSAWTPRSRGQSPTRSLPGHFSGRRRHCWSRRLLSNSSTCSWIVSMSVFNRLTTSRSSVRELLMSNRLVCRPSLVVDRPGPPDDLMLSCNRLSSSIESLSSSARSADRVDSPLADADSAAAASPSISTGSPLRSLRIVSICSKNSVGLSASPAACWSLRLMSASSPPASGDNISYETRKSIRFWTVSWIFPWNCSYSDSVTRLSSVSDPAGRRWSAAAPSLSVPASAPRVVAEMSQCPRPLSDH